jgi:predicted glutamine amidotransferase
MCGIVGLISFHEKEYLKRKEFIKQGLIASSLRGVDGTGVFLVPHNPKELELTVVKKPLPSYDFVNLHPFDHVFRDLEKYKFVVGHTRLKTRGDIKHAHTHPFTFGHITLVHNGSISNAYQVAKSTFLEVDSMAVAKALSEEEDYKKVLESLEGAFALVWYDSNKDTLYMARNSERPLFYVVNKKDEIIYFGSELRMLDWITSRTGNVIDDRFEVGESTVLSFTNSLKCKISSFKTTKEAIPVHRDAWGKFTRRSNGAHTVDEGVYIYGPTAIPYLTPSGLSLHEDVIFGFDSWDLKTERSRHGVLNGTQLSGQFLSVLAQGVEHKPIATNEFLKAKVIGVRLKDKEVTVLVDPRIEVMSHSSESSKQLLLPGTPPNLTGRRSKSIWHNGIDEADREEHVVDGERKGPLGMLPVAEFNKLIEEGCTACGTPITVSDKELRWTLDGHPICPDCATIFHDSAALMQ